MHYPVQLRAGSWRIVEEYVVRWRNGTLGELVRYEEAA